MMSFDTWMELRQSGRLLDRRALELLPEVDAAPYRLAERLRDVLTGSLRGEGLSAFLDVVLEDACGLREGFLKGSQVGASFNEGLLDGTQHKPRRVLMAAGENGEKQPVLAVFTSTASRVGMHQGRRDVARAVEYLRRRKLPLGIVTNGRELRLVFADTDNLAWVEWVAERWLEGDSLAPSLHILRRILAPRSLEPSKEGMSLLLAAIRHARQGQAKLSKELGERVRRAVELLLRERSAVLEASWDREQAKAVYDAACHFVMRLVVVLFAEARELLPVENPVYHHAYGLRGLFEALDRAGADRRNEQFSAFPRLIALFRLLHRGSSHPGLVLTALGGELLAPGRADGDPLSQALSRIESPSHPPSDEAVYQMLLLLTRTTERVREGVATRIVASPVDFTELTSEYIGILYEGLLDYELHRAGEEPVVFLNVGDQPALPLGRLEAMSDAEVAQLIEKAKTSTRRLATGDDEGDEDEESDEAAEEELLEEDEDEAEEITEAAPSDDAAELSLDDARGEARRRAFAWASRAALAGKLVRAPRGRRGKDDPAFLAQLDAASKQLIADVKLPGELYLVRWGGTRKGAGTFYTRPQLTLPTVRRTLEPLLFDASGKTRSPEALLSLKVCDPAMGSGSFLVAALRVLTEAVVTSLNEHRRIRRQNGLEPAGASKTVAPVYIDCPLFPEADRRQAEDRVSAIVQRVVVEHCLYGVDLDPLAVELARVSLWIETMDRKLPLTFLDHKLRTGNALIGAYLDRFRDYPLLAFWRQSADEKWKGAHHEGDTWTKALRKARASVVEDQQNLLAGALLLPFPGFKDDEIEAAFAKLRGLYEKIRNVPASRPDERARIWREEILTNADMARVREALDTWCALWFWPLDSLDDAPRPSELLSPTDKAREVARKLAEEKRFFHWELEFPDVFTEKGAGFDAIVGNPPWEIQKPNSKEFFSDLDPLYRSYGKQQALKRQQELFASDAGIEERWLDYNAGFKDAGNFVRHAGEPFGDKENGQDRPLVALVPRRANDTKTLHARWNATRRTREALGLSDPEHPFRHQGSADLNTYKLFVEQAYALAKSGGQIGLVVPSGLYTDKGSMELRKLLLERCAWRWLYGFENRNKVFDIDSRFKFGVTIAEKGGESRALKAAFMRHDLEDWGEARGALAYPAERIHAFSPKSLSVLELRSDRDLEVLTKVYANSVLLGDDGPEGWGIKYGTEFHMTNDSKLFVAREKAEQKGFKPDAYGRWVGPEGDVLLPLYEGRMIGQFDYSKKGWVSGRGRAAVWRDIGWNQKVIEPQFLMSQSTYREHLPLNAVKVAMMNIGSATNMRTMIAAVVPDYPANHALATLTPSDASFALPFVSVLNSTIFDWAIRLRLGGLNVSWFVLEESPLPPVAHEMISSAKHSASLSTLGLAFAPMGRSRFQRNAITPHERLRLRVILDAVVAALYGLSRDDLRWILRDCDHPVPRLRDRAFCRTLDPKGFWRVDKEEHPEKRHTVLTLVAFDELSKLIEEHGREEGIAAFAELNEGEGWMLPASLRLADYGLGHDERANEEQPVAEALGPRFLDWQLAQSVEESWAECERHARAILGEEEFERRFGREKEMEKC